MIKSFKQYLKDEVANTVANVQGLQTEPLITKKRQYKLVRRAAKNNP